MSHSQFHCINLFILRHAWLNLWDKHMTTGRINQVTTLHFLLLDLKLLKALHQNQSENKWETLGLSFGISLQDCLFYHSAALQILKHKIYTTRMHPFRSVNMFFSQFMQTQSFRFDQPNREWMLLKPTLTAFKGRIAQLVCTQMFWC